jgi:hypothetical protein
LKKFQEKLISKYIYIYRAVFEFAMSPYIGFKCFICVFLSSILVLVACDEGRTSTNKIFYTLTPMKSDPWWKMYVNASSDYRDFREDGESDAVTLNGSVINLGAVNLKESGIDDVESEFNWRIVTKMSQEVVKGRLPPKASEEGTRLGNGTHKLGEYFGVEILPASRCEESCVLGYDAV